MNVNQLVSQALRLMSAGFSMVFLVLAIFYGLVKALLILFPAKEEKEED
jgi:Na+-transporting methylmalonyl-CoA/oxaloacetate decarboxylase gamma subunit